MVGLVKEHVGLAREDEGGRKLRGLSCVVAMLRNEEPVHDFDHGTYKNSLPNDVICSR